MKPCVLLVSKVPTIERLTRRDLDALVDNGLADRRFLEDERDAHHGCFARLEAALQGCQLRKRLVQEVRADDGVGLDLAVSVGGDGTVFTVHRLLGEVPLIAINSDPHRSVGYFTRGKADDFPALLAAWRERRASHQLLPRLAVEIGSGPRELILNDCLFTSASPAAVSHYVLQVEDRQERQYSSGVWVATAAGSTGGIHSAGAEPVDAATPALLWRVREPYQGRGPISLLSGRQLPPLGLELRAVMPGLHCYIDGCHTSRPAPPGTPVRFSANPLPLRLVVGQ